MKVPPLIIGLTLLFWGEETDNLLIGGLLCLLMEGSNLIKTRYMLSEEDFIKISDVTSLFFLASVALVLLNFEPINFLRLTAGWLPLSLSPLIAAQLYSTGDTVVIGTRLGKKKKAHAYKPLDFRFYYLTICIFAAATGNSRSLWFYPVLGGLFAWLLFQNRGRSFSPIHFLLFFALSLGGGYATIRGIEFVQQQVLERAHSFWHGYYREKLRDPFKAHVNFGEIGKLKISGEIVMRVSTSESPPALFKEASYTTFAGGSWFGKQDFVFLAPVEDGRWDLIDPPHKEGKMVSVQYNLPKEKGLLPYPQGGYRLQSKTIFEMEKNKSGVIKVVDGAPVISYDLWYHPAMQSTTDPPDGKNLVVPDKEKYALQEVVEKNETSETGDADKIAALKRYFQKDFQYSLNFLGKEEYDTPLGNFLLKRKSGFCEYYATATALLLRSMGIPSRYAVGYAVYEKSRLEGKYVVRKRHAHAWAEAFVDHQWIVVDTTPSNWLEKDREQVPFYEVLQDVFYLIRHHYRLFRIGTGAENTLAYSIIVIVLTSFLVLRIYRRLKIEKAEREKKTIKMRSFATIVSPFTPVLEIIMQSEVNRREKERFVDWVARIYPWTAFNQLEFKELYGLHLRRRFDPEGLRIEETERLRQGADKILKEIQKISRQRGDSPSA
ncbi:MAG: transglutaminase-like domain-containing protein [Pseudomonadota bacterium]